MQIKDDAKSAKTNSKEMLEGPKGTDKNGATGHYIHLNVYSKPWSRVDDVQADACKGMLVDQDPDEDLWSVPSKPKSRSLINDQSKKIDLYSFYQMLHSIRNELVCGSPSSSSTQSPDSHYGSMSEEELDSEDVNSLVDSAVCDNTNDKHADHLALLFRQHLTGLFLVLRQLTDAADYCSKKYQDEVDKQ
uniref:Uncharacterized protein n=1 Tax=Romanomermis culicivorax TaxID=13658 RepID=A0A915LBL3_ROMCU